MQQYAALRAAGIQTPHTIAVTGTQAMIKAARQMATPFITKHNRGGKGLGVYLFQHSKALAAAIEDARIELPVDGIYLVQQYIQSHAPFITRCEFIDGQLVYAVQVSTENGFELCPADACQAGDAWCPTTEGELPRFHIIDSFNEPLLVKRYQAFLQANAIEVAGIEFITDGEGRHWTYDVNTNTNYNHAAEERAKVSAPKRLARFLGSLLNENTTYAESAVI